MIFLFLEEFMDRSKINPRWIKDTKKYFKDFLEASNFPDIVRHGERGTEFNYPEWTIMFISILSVKCKVKTYIGIHRLSCKYWKYITPKKDLKPISERQLRDRLKKIGHQLGKPPGFIFQIFPESYLN